MEFIKIILTPPHAALNKNEKLITIGMAFIMNKEENRLFGMPLCTI